MRTASLTVLALVAAFLFSVLPAQAAMDHGSGAAHYSDRAFAPMKKAMQHMLEEGKNLGANMRFVELMLPHHAMALEMSVPALLGSNNPQILNLAENIIISQAKEMRQFKAWIAEHHKK